MFNRLKSKERNDLNTNSEICLCESLFVEVEIEKKIVVGVIYKPPDTGINTFNTRGKKRK